MSHQYALVLCGGDVTPEEMNVVLRLAHDPVSRDEWQTRGARFFLIGDGGTSAFSNVQKLFNSQAEVPALDEALTELLTSFFRQVPVENVDTEALHTFLKEHPGELITYVLVEEPPQP